MSGHQLARRDEPSALVERQPNELWRPPSRVILITWVDRRRTPPASQWHEVWRLVLIAAAAFAIGGGPTLLFMALVMAESR
jgi:hypothetical protein